MDFRYRAINLQGEIQRGSLTAAHPEELAMRLQGRGLELLTYKTGKAWWHTASRRIPRRELIHFCFHLEQLCRVGVPLHEALRDLRDSLEDKAFRELVNELLEELEAGQSFSGALCKHPEAFSAQFTSLIRAGELSGQLPEILAKLCHALKTDDEFLAHTYKLMIYPALVALVILAATAFLMHSLVPQLKTFIQHTGQSWPLHTRMLFAVADLLKQYGLMLVLATTSMLSLLRLAHARNPSLQQAFDRLQLRLPLIGAVLQKIMLARLAGTFALLYAAGIPVLEALRISRSVIGNRHLESALHGIEQAVAAGSNLTTAFDATKLFPRLVIRMLRVGESTGELDLALQNVDYFYQRDVRESMSRIQALIEPAMTICLGGLLGWIMLAVIGPIYDILGKVQP